MLSVTFEGESIREAIAKLQQVDPNLKKMLIKDLKTSIKPIATEIAKAIPGENNPPLSGMRSGYARLRWGGVKATVSVTPGKKKGATRLVSIVVTGNPDAGFKMVELAGTRSNGEDGRGINMIKVLRQRFPTPGSGKGGRFAYMKFREEKPAVTRLAVELIDKHLEDVNRSF